MEQYISKSAVVAEIDDMLNTKEHTSHCDEDSFNSGRWKALTKVKGFLNTLKVKEDIVSTDTTSPNTLKISRNGNSCIEAMKEALHMEYEKGRADVLRCIDPDEMVADFCSQPLSKTRSLASIYRQGIIDIIKRINNNEKTSITNTRSIDDGGVHRA